MTARGIPCVCVDGDPMCVNANYLLSKQSGDEYMLPLFMDITNPSPPFGFASVERIGFLERPKPDLVLALAVLHHLRVSGNIPFEMLAGFLARLSQAIAVFLLVPPSVYAYLDPGTGSIAYQILVGGTLAAVATIRLYWKKIVRLLRGRRAEKR